MSPFAFWCVASAVCILAGILLCAWTALPRYGIVTPAAAGPPATPAVYGWTGQTGGSVLFLFGVALLGFGFLAGAGSWIERIGVMAAIRDSANTQPRQVAFPAGDVPEAPEVKKVAAGFEIVGMKADTDHDFWILFAGQEPRKIDKKGDTVQVKAGEEARVYKTKIGSFIASPAVVIKGGP